MDEYEKPGNAVDINAISNYVLTGELLAL